MRTAPLAQAQKCLVVHAPDHLYLLRGTCQLSYLA